MLRSVVRRILKKRSGRGASDLDYWLALYSASPRALRKLARVRALIAHREVVPKEAAFAAQLVGALTENCGPCTQIHVNMARSAGVDDAQIEAVLKADFAAMSADTALAYRFASAIVLRAADQGPAREAVRAAWGEKGVIDLTFAMQASRIFPMIKAGLGFAAECRQVMLGSRSVNGVRRPA